MKKSPVIGGFGMSLENINNKIQFNKENLKTIYLAGGCFWGVETYISRILGVYKTEVGYANGNTKIQLMKKYVTLIQNMRMRKSDIFTRFYISKRAIGRIF